MAPGYSKRDIQIMDQWLKSEQVKSYINACRQRQENHAFEKARCKEYFAELFYQDAQKGFKMECPPALWVLAIFCRFLFALLRKPALDLMESGGHWNWPYWLGELFCCGGMVLQLAIAKIPQLSTTKARVTRLAAGLRYIPYSHRKWTKPDAWRRGINFPLNTNIGPKALSVTTATNKIAKEPSDAAADNAYKLRRELLQLTIPNPYNRR
ncbi:TPA_exp: Uncharacterized protein A8136_6864 [Trichophyton benhamiae CBS 112371]|nr:TPA_exp: Uncharacterized protein A8136_6864 [Trichophyton benhamiae CBS 112371]